MKIKLTIALISLFSIITFSSILAQGMPSGGGGGRDRVDGVKFMPIPYINYDRAIGASVGALPMIMFNPVENDTLSPSSVAGAFGMYAQNKTWFVMAFTKMFFKEDKWRFTLAGGTGEINYQFQITDPIDIWIPYNTDANFLYAGFERKLAQNLYGGLNFVYSEFITSGENVPLVDTANLKGLGLTLTYDRRDSYYYPKAGYITNLKYNTNPEFLDNSYVSNKIELDGSYFIPMRGWNDIIASRLYVGLGLGDLSFNQQFIVGQNDIRGYSQGAFRGNYMVTLQSEYRWNFHKRIGMVGFIGIATIFEAINESDNGKILPGAGVGVRVTMQEDTNFNVGMDVAKGVDDWSLSFMIGEAF